MVENLSKFLKTNNLDHKICGFEQKVAQKCTLASESKANREAEPQPETVDAHAPGHERTNVRSEHQAPTHARTSGESTKRTVHIQQWGSHPLSLAGWQGPAKLFAN